MCWIPAKRPALCIKNMITKGCDWCKKEIKIKKCKLRTSKNTFCSRQCFWIWKKDWYLQHPEEREKIRAWATGRKQSKGTVEKRISKNRGAKRTLAQRKRISESIPKGANNHFWRGGVSTVRKSLRECSSYKLWRDAVFKRDNFKCVFCKKGGDLEADHIVPFSKIIENIRLEVGENDLFEKCILNKKLWDIDNGRALCVGCHRKTDTYAVNTCYM